MHAIESAGNPTMSGRKPRTHAHRKRRLHNISAESGLTHAATAENQPSLSGTAVAILFGKLTTA